MGTLSARALAHRCTITRASKTADGQGGHTETWSTVATGVECRMVNTPGLGQPEMHGRMAAEPETTLYVRQAVDLAEGDRVNVSGALYDVGGTWLVPEAYYRAASITRCLDA